MSENMTMANEKIDGDGVRKLNQSFWRGQKILLTGAGGFLGWHVKEAIAKLGVKEDQIFAPSSKQADLRERAVCRKVCEGKSLVIHMAANVGGIGYNRDFPGSMVYDNLIMGCELLEAARLQGVEKFVSIGTACEYPADLKPPFNEKDLWKGYPDPITAPYGLAKKMLLVMGQAYRQQYDFNSIHLLLSNLYGPRDHFDAVHGHVIPALIVKFFQAIMGGDDVVEIWGTGAATREFLFCEDAARAILLAAEHYDKPEPVNIGNAVETSIRLLAETIGELADFEGEICFDSTKPEGKKRFSFDTKRARAEFGFQAGTELRDGLKKTMEWYENTIKSGQFSVFGNK